MSKRIVCALLTLILLVGLIPVNALPAFAKESGMTGVVTNTDKVNIRKHAGVQNKLVTQLKKGTKVTVYETVEKDNAVWGRIDEGWVYMFYIQLDRPAPKPGTNEKVIASGTVNSNINLNVRNGAGVENDLQTSLPRGTKVYIYEKTSVNGVQWGRIDRDSWVCLMYVTLDNTIEIPEGVLPDGEKPETAEPAVARKAKVVNCEPGVNIRNGAGVHHALIGNAPVNSVVTYYEETMVNGVKWVRTDKGWVCTQYLQNLDPILPNGGNGGTGGNEGSSGNTGVNATGIVVSKVNLNIRAGAGLDYVPVSSVKPGTRINLYEQTMRNGMSWGRTDGGWVCLAYVTLESTGNSGTGEMGTVVRCYSTANVRSGPSTAYALVGTIAVNSRVEVLEQKNHNGKMWARLPQGWVCMDYIMLDSEMPNPPKPEGNTPNNPDTPNNPVVPDTDMVSYYIGCIVDLSSGLKIRSSATSDTDNIVGELKNGTNVQLKGLKQVGSKLWGKVENGWIDLTFVKFNSDAIVRADKLTAYKVASLYSDPSGEVKKDQFVTITGLALEGNKVLGRVAAGWIDLAGVEIGGKKGDPVNTNPEVPFAGYGTNVAGAKTHVQAIAASADKHALSASKKRDILALKADMEDAKKTWAKLEIDGTIGWISLSDLAIKMPALVKADLTSVHLEADSKTTIVKSLNKDTQVEVTYLRVNGQEVWGKVSGGWILMDKLLIDGKLDPHVNRNPEVRLNATLNAKSDVTARLDAFVGAEGVAILPAGDFQIYGLKADDTKADTYWVKVMLNGVTLWVELDSSITIDFKALVTAPSVTLYDDYKAGAKPATVVNKYANLTIKDLAVVGNVAWGLTPGGWVEMTFVEVGGKAPAPTNPNTEFSVKIHGKTAQADTRAYAEAHDSTDLLKTLAADTNVDIYAVKADVNDASKLWAATIRDGIPCWIKLSDLKLTADAIVVPESIQKYAAPGKASNLAGKAVHNEKLRIEDLALADGKVWGKDGISNTWIAMEGVEVDGVPTAWPNNNRFTAFEATVYVKAATTSYQTPSSLSIPAGAENNIAVGDHKINGLKMEGSNLWAQVVDQYGNTSWINLTACGFEMAVYAKGEKCNLREKPSKDGKVLAVIPDGTALTMTNLTIMGDIVWGSTGYGTQSGWVSTNLTTR